MCFIERENETDREREREREKGFLVNVQICALEKINYYFQNNLFWEENLV